MEKRKQGTIYRWNAGLSLLAGPQGPVCVRLGDDQWLIGRSTERALLESFREARVADSLSLGESQIVESFIEARFIVEVGHESSRNATAFWDSLGISPHAPVRVAAEPTIEAQLASLLEANGVRLTPDAEFTVSVGDEMLHQQTGTSLTANLFGKELRIGPLLSAPGGKAGLCYDCLNYWSNLRRWPEFTVKGMQPAGTAETPGIAWLPSTVTIGIGAIAQAATLCSAGRSALFRQSRWIFDMGSLAVTSAPIRPRANCVQCDPAAQPDNGFLGNPRTGIIQELRLACAGETGFYLAHATALLPLPEPGERNPLPPLSTDGKGWDMETATERCIFEAVERHSCVWRGNERVVRGAARSLPGAINPNELLQFSENQYRDRDRWNALPGELHGVPERFNPDREAAWFEARPLAGGQTKMVLAGCVKLWYPFRGEPMYSLADTNGCAAAPTRELAELHGLLELIERDAVGIWWNNRMRKPSVDWRNVDAKCAALGEWLKAIGRSLQILDITTDLLAPAYAAISANSAGRRVYFASAADLDGVVAARRAIEELVQFVVWGDHLGPGVDRQMWLDKSSLAEQAFLCGEGPVPIRMPVSRAGLLEALHAKGINPVSVDLTCQEIGIPVVRILAPGLCHYGPRYGPARLYQTPLQLGWLDRERDESEMNPDFCVL